MPPVTAAAQAENTSGTPCFGSLYANAVHAPGDIVGGSYCSRDGRLGAGGGLNDAGYGTVPVTRHAEYFVEIQGVDAASGAYIFYAAPKGALVYSPITSLILHAPQAAVKRALGLDGGVFALSSDRDLTQFSVVSAWASADPIVRADAERVAAANLRVLAVAVPLGGTHPYFVSTPDYDDFGAYIAAHPAFVFDNTAMSQFVAGRLGSWHSAKVISAVAHLINAYAAAIPVRISDDATARQFMLGIHGVLAVEIKRLLDSATPVAADAAADVALAITSQQLIDATVIFRGAVPFPATGHFYPAPNFLESSASTLRIQADEVGASSFSGSLVSNDVFAQGVAQGNGGFYPAQSSVQSVSVPVEHAGNITATLVDDPSGRRVEVAALGGFRGRTYFDYQVRHPSGELGTARVYLHFR